MFSASVPCSCQKAAFVQCGEAWWDAAGQRGAHHTGCSHLPLVLVGVKRAPQSVHLCTLLHYLNYPQ